MTGARDCKHGRLARSCEICELEADLNALRSAAQAVLDSAEQTFNGAVEVSEESLARLEAVVD
jgi:hypothetical protein